MKKRIKLAVVGSASLSRKDAAMLAKAILTNVLCRYRLSLLVTIKEDPIGLELRKLVKAEKVKVKTYSEARHSDQSNADELTAADILWETTNYILVHNGSSSWAQHLSEILHRRGRRYKLLEVSNK